MSIKSVCAAALCVAVIGLAAAPAQAGCRINVGVKNTSAQQISVGRHASRVKSKGGTWRSLGTGYWGSSFGDYGWFILDNGEQYIDRYKAAFRCGAKRRYRFSIRCNDPATGTDVVITHYYPSATTWTTQQSFVANLTCQPG